MKRLFQSEKHANRFAALCTAGVGTATALHYALRNDSLSGTPRLTTEMPAGSHGVKVVRFALDREKTSLNFMTSHLTGSVPGKFTDFRGRIEVALSQGKVEVKLVDVEVQAHSIDTNSWLRDYRV